MHCLKWSKHLTAHFENILSVSLIFQGRWKFGTDRSLAGQILFLLLGVKVMDLLISLLVETVESGWEQCFLRRTACAKLSCWTKGGGKTIGGVLSLWNSHHSASRRTWPCCINSGLKGYTDMWAAACFPSILGVHRRKGEYVSLLSCYQRATQHAWGSKEKAIYFRGDCLYERLFLLIMWAKTNNRMMQKG